MARLKGKWRMKADDMKSATIMLEYRHPDGSMGDVVAVPVGDMTPATLVRISNASPGDMYDVIMESNAILYKPVSISTVMSEGSYDDVEWPSEDSKVLRITDDDRLDRVSLSIMRTAGREGADGDVFTMELPIPSGTVLDRLLGRSE